MDEQIRALDKMFGVSVEGELVNSIYLAMEEYLACVEKLTGYDVDNWVNWYVFENDCGKKGLLANDKHITSVEDLVNILEEE